MESTEETEPMAISLFLAEDDIINMGCKVVFCIKKEEAREFIGLSFEEVDELSLSRIKGIIDLLGEDG